MGTFILFIGVGIVMAWMRHSWYPLLMFALIAILLVAGANALDMLMETGINMRHAFIR